MFKCSPDSACVQLIDTRLPSPVEVRNQFHINWKIQTKILSLPEDIFPLVCSLFSSISLVFMGWLKKNPIHYLLTLILSKAFNS